MKSKQNTLTYRECKGCDRQSRPPHGSCIRGVGSTRRIDSGGVWVAVERRGRRTAHAVTAEGALRGMDDWTTPVMLGARDA